MSNVSLPKPGKSCDGWETIEDGSQDFDAPANIQQQKEPSDSGHDENQAQPEPEPTSERKLEKMMLVDEHQHYDIVIESPGMKAPQRIIYDVPDDDDEDEITANKNKESEEEFISLARKNFDEERNLATASSDD